MGAAIGIIVGLIIGLIIGYNSAGDSKELEALLNEKKLLADKNNELRKEIDTLQAKITNLEEQI